MIRSVADLMRFADEPTRGLAAMRERTRVGNLRTLIDHANAVLALLRAPQTFTLRAFNGQLVGRHRVAGGTLSPDPVATRGVPSITWTGILDETGPPTITFQAAGGGNLFLATAGARMKIGSAPNPLLQRFQVIFRYQGTIALRLNGVSLRSEPAPSGGLYVSVDGTDGEPIVCDREAIGAGRPGSPAWEEFVVEQAASPAPGPTGGPDARGVKSVEIVNQTGTDTLAIWSFAADGVATKVKVLAPGEVAKVIPPHQQALRVRAISFQAVAAWNTSFPDRRHDPESESAALTMNFWKLDAAFRGDSAGVEVRQEIA